MRELLGLKGMQAEEEGDGCKGERGVGEREGRGETRKKGGNWV